MIVLKPEFCYHAFMNDDALLRVKLFYRRRLRSTLPPRTAATRRRSAERVAARWAHWTRFRRARHVGLYVPYDWEMDTSPLLDLCRRLGKHVSAPALDETMGRLRFLPWPTSPGDWRRNVRGFREPVSAADPAAPPLDLLVVPGTAFTAVGERLGAGGGYYDRFLADHPRLTTVGLAFDEQVVPWLPTGGHDRRMDAVATPGRLILCRGRAR
jgi:5-formyltetrahydrofolate cyclo-ligase